MSAGTVFGSAGSLRFALWAVLLVALALRLWGLHYGLPALFYFVDEQPVVLHALRFGTGDFNPHFFLWPASTLYYLAFFAFGAWFVLGRVLGWWSNAQGFAASYFQDPSPFYLLARLQSVAFGVWTVWLGYSLGTAGCSASVGLAVAIGLTVNAVCGHYAHLAHPVTAMTAFTLLGLVAAVRIANGGGRRDLVLGALALGLGAASQYHAALLVVPLGVAVLSRMIREPQRRSWWLSRLLLVGLGGVAVFLVVSPYVALDFRTFYTDLKYEYSLTRGALGGRSPGLFPGGWMFLRSYLVPALGWPMTVAAALGTVWAVWRRTPTDCVLLSFSVVYAALASHGSILIDRYTMPLLAPALFFAARLIEALVDRLSARQAAASEAARRARSTWLVPAVALVLCVPTAVNLVRTDYMMTQEDTRMQALRWFESHVPADSRVVLDTSQFCNDATAPVRENRTRIEERLAETSNAAYGKAHHSTFYTEYYRYQLEHLHSPAYYLRRTDPTRLLAEYRREGFTWAMVTGRAPRAEDGVTDLPGGSIPLFYRELSRECVLAAEFRPEPWKRLGPVIRVYRLSPMAATP